jgi:predicted DNA binding CopG/RHH family protein
MLVPKKTLRALPSFASEDAEREFWGSHDSADYLDWSEAERVVLPNLKPTTSTISLRIPEALLENLKLLANKRDIGYQSLLKIFLAERIQKELRTAVTEGTHETLLKKAARSSKVRKSGFKTASKAPR